MNKDAHAASLVDEPDRLVTVGWAAAFLGLSTSKVYRYMAKGLLEYKKFDRSRRLSKRELLRFATEHTTGGLPADVIGRRAEGFYGQ